MQKLTALASTPDTLQAEHDAYKVLCDHVQDAASLMMSIALELDGYACALEVCGNSKLAGDLRGISEVLKRPAPGLRQALSHHLHAMVVESSAQTDRLFMGMLQGVLGPIDRGPQQ